MVFQYHIIVSLIDKLVYVLIRKHLSLESFQTEGRIYLTHYKLLQLTCKYFAKKKKKVNNYSSTVKC